MRKVKNLILFENSQGKTYGIDLNQKCWIGVNGTPIKNKPANCSQTFRLAYHTLTEAEHPLTYFFARMLANGFNLQDIFTKKPNTIMVLDRLESLNLNKDYNINEESASWALQNFAKILKDYKDHNTLDFRLYYRVAQRKEWLQKHSLLSLDEDYQDWLYKYFYNRPQCENHISRIIWYIQKYRVYEIYQSYQKYSDRDMLVYSHNTVDLYLNMICSMAKFATALNQPIPKGEISTVYLQMYETYKLNEKGINDKAIQDNQLGRNLEFASGQYVVIVPTTSDEIKDEATQQKNCVYRSYCDKVVKGITNIVFIRDVNDIKKSLVTCEVRNGSIWQYLAHSNTYPNDELMAFKKLYQDHLNNNYINKQN